MMQFCSDYDGSHAYVSDFYPEFSVQLKAALTHYENFDTGWQGVKKEIQSFRVVADKKRVTVYVSASMDEDVELIEDAIFSVIHREDYDYVIREALENNAPIAEYLDRDVSHMDALLWLSEHAPEETQSSDTIAEERFQRNIEPEIAYAQIVSALDQCADIATQELDDRFKVLENWVRYLLTGDAEPITTTQELNEVSIS